MKLKIFFLCILIVLAAIVYFAATNRDKKPDITNGISSTDYKQLEYVIENEKVKLGTGGYEYFGNEIKKDLNSDGKDDVAFIISQQTGGTGIFFYVVAALQTPSGYTASSGFFIGDRIAPQTTESGPGPSIIVNYMDRAPGEPFSEEVSVGKSIRLIFDPKHNGFGVVEKDFEGEVDPALMKLDMKKWVWIKTVYQDGKEMMPKNPGKFSVTFNKDARFTATTDCNGMGGSYATINTNISFSSIVSTMMFCEGSQEGDFVKFLESATSYHFTSHGELILDSKTLKASVVFK